MRATGRPMDNRPMLIPHPEDQPTLHRIGVPSLETVLCFSRHANISKHVKMFIWERTFAVLVVRCIKKNMQKMIFVDFNSNVFRKIANFTWKESTTLLESSCNIFSPFLRFIRYTFDSACRWLSNCRNLANFARTWSTFSFPLWTLIISVKWVSLYDMKATGRLRVSIFAALKGRNIYEIAQKGQRRRIQNNPYSQPSHSSFSFCSIPFSIWYSTGIYWHPVLLGMDFADNAGSNIEVHLSYNELRHLT